MHGVFLEFCFAFDFGGSEIEHAGVHECDSKIDVGIADINSGPMSFPLHVNEPVPHFTNVLFFRVLAPSFGFDTASFKFRRNPTNKPKQEGAQ